MDYTKYSAEELEALSMQAFSEYYALAVRPCGNWHAGMTFPELEEATRRLEEINDETLRRMNAQEGSQA